MCGLCMMYEKYYSSPVAEQAKFTIWTQHAERWPRLAPIATQGQSTRPKFSTAEMYETYLP